MLTNQDQQPATYLKAKQGKELNTAKKNNLKAVMMLLGFLVFIGGAVSVFLISQGQNTTPVAPNVPQSKPAAFIEKTQTCTLVFDVTEPDKLACGQEACETDSDCSDDLICITADDDKKYCAKEEYEDACTADPSAETCCSAPEEETLACGEAGCVSTDDCEEGFVCIATSETDDDDNIVKYCADEDFLDACVADPSQASCCTAPEDEVLTCGEKGCESDSDCEDDLVCVTADDDKKYCAKEEYEDACIDEPSNTTCCTAPTITGTITTTITGTITATGTVTPKVTTVTTTVGCNDECVANADCANISHICYQGQCRLDVNPTDAQCRLPSGETTIVRPVHVPTESGPADWLNYLKAGLGVLGVGALLLLLL